ncbi:MAG: VWA domain-containing protein [Phycisphaerales bacterium JB041]
MTFLAPVPAIIAAAVAVPAVLVLYFLKLRRRPVRVGTTMLWRQAAEDLQANVPFRMLRPSVLLLVQLIILALLLLALARPAIDVTGAMPARAFIVIDRSASMRATDMPDGQDRFTEAARLATRAIERVTSGNAQTRVTLIAFAAEPEIIAGPTGSRTDLLRALRGLAPNDQPGDLASALRLVQALSTPDDEASTDRPLVVVCSDGSTDRARTDGLPALAADLRFERAGPPTPGDNLGLVALAARRDHDAPSLIRVFARIQSTMTEEVPISVSIALNGEVVSRRAVDARAATEEGPGQTPVALEVQAPGEALLTLTIDRADVLEADDSASVVLGAPRRPAVLLVRESEDETAGAGWLLTDVLRELDLSGLTLISADRLASLGPGAYAGADLAIFDGVPAPFPAPVPSVHFGGAASVAPLRTTAGPGRVLPILAWERSSPLLRDISLDAVRVGRGVLLQEAGEDAAFTELARTAAGVVLASVRDGQTTRVVAGFDLVQSTWPVDYSFPLFLANTLESLSQSGASMTGWAATTAEPANPPGLSATAAEGAAVLTDPAGNPRARATSPDGPARLGVLETAGVWRIDTSLVPVNLVSPAESALASPTSLPVPGGAIRQASDGAGRGEPREIWPWFLLAAAAVLGVEWVLFGQRAKVS